MRNKGFGLLIDKPSMDFYRAVCLGLGIGSLIQKISFPSNIGN